MMNFNLFSDMHDELISHEPDGYYIAGDMINEFMLTHPHLKHSWKNMTADERWIFVEAMHYGIETLIRKSSGYVQQ